MKYALCNEVLAHLPFEAQCKAAAELGYHGLEIAPFTLTADPSTLTDQEAQRFAAIARDHGLRVAGLHWLLVAPKGLSIVSADDAVRRRTADFMCRLVELCAAMGGSYLVHGSPKQRSIPPGESREAALDRARECLASAAEAAERHGVVYCLEPLAQSETDLINTVAEALALVDAIGSPALQGMIDCSAASQAEAEGIDDLMARWMPAGRIGHVQVNDRNRRGPGQGMTDFAPILQTLLRMEEQGHYRGWIGFEPFDYVPDGLACAARSIGFVDGMVKALRFHG